MFKHSGFTNLIKKLLWAVIYGFLFALVCVFISEGIKNNAVRVVKSLGLESRSLTELPKSMTFRIDLLGGLPVGKARLANNGVISYRDKQVYHLSAQAQTIGITAALFNAQAETHSYIDKNSLRTLMFKQILTRPDEPKEEREIIYDHDNLMMELNGVRRQILADTQDPLSVIYYLGRQRFDPGKEFDININTNQKNYRLFLKVLRKEEIYIKGTKTGIWVVKGDIRRRNKSPRHSSTMTIWLLDNPSKTPLLTKIVASGVLVTARLIDIK